MPKKKFLVVVDTQYDFMMTDGALPVPRAEELIIPGMKFLANLDPEKYAGVLFTYDTHNPDVYTESEEAKLFPLHCVEGTPGWENVFNESLVPSGIVKCSLHKGVFNMWGEEGLEINDGLFDPLRDKFFSEIVTPETHEIEIMGVAADYCVFWAIQGFRERGFRVIVLDTLTRGIDRSMTKVVMDEFRHDHDVVLRG